MLIVYRIVLFHFFTVISMASKRAEVGIVKDFVILRISSSGFFITFFVFLISSTVTFFYKTYLNIIWFCFTRLIRSPNWADASFDNSPRLIGLRVFRRFIKPAFFNFS